MRRLVSVFLCIMGILFAVQVRAQTAQTEMRLTIDECVEIALSNNPRIEQDKYAVALAEAQVDGARNAFLPTGSAFTWSVNRNVRGPREGSVLDETTGEIITLVGEENITGGHSVGIGGFSIPIYDGADIATLAARKNGYQSQEMTQRSNRHEVVFTVKANYYQLLQAIKLLEVQQERVRVSEESLRRSETLYEIGSAAILQVANAKAALANERATLIQRENDVLIRRSTLAYEMGLGTNVDILPVEEDFEIVEPGYTYEEALKFALERNPGILATKYDMLASKDTYRATKYSLYHPTVTVNVGGYGWSISEREKFGGLEDLFLKNYNYGMSINVRMPIFNLNTTNNLKQQRLQYMRSQIQLDQAKRQKALNVKLRYLTLERLRREIEAQEVSVEAQEENFKLQEERYNFGGGTFLDRLTAQRDLFNARNQLVQAQYLYLIEIARLENELGVSTEK